MLLFSQVILQGARAALRYWRLLAPLYLVGLLLGLAQTWPLLAVSGALYNPILGDLANGSRSVFDLWLAAPESAGTTTGLWGLTALLLGGLMSLAYNFFAGGILAVYASDVTAERASPLFWRACGRWFWSFTGLGALLVVLALLALGVAAAVGAALGVAVGTAAALLLLALINTLGEYARALAVARGRHRPFALLGLALGFFRYHLPGVLGLALLGLLLHVALSAVYVALSRAMAGSLALVLVQQLAVLGWLWVKLLRLAWAASYVGLAPGVSGPAAQQAPAVVM